jgi:hypothetical protein
MTNDEFVYYLLLKQEWERFQKSLNEKIKSKQGFYARFAVGRGA